MPAWECNAVTKYRANGAFDPARRYWRDMQGREGHAPAHAFAEALEFDQLDPGATRVQVFFGAVAGRARGTVRGKPEGAEVGGGGRRRGAGGGV